MQEELNINQKDFEDIKQNAADDKPWLAAIKIGYKWKKLSSTLEKLSDEDFWLMAPAECGVAKGIDNNKIELSIEDLFGKDDDTP